MLLLRSLFGDLIIRKLNWIYLRALYIGRQYLKGVKPRLFVALVDRERVETIFALVEVSPTFFLGSCS